MSLLTESEEKVTPPLTPLTGTPAVSLERVSVDFLTQRERIGSLKEYAIRLLQGKVTHEHFHALRDVSLEINHGEIFGVIGHNGAGKSTLLKVVSRVMRPTKGRVIVRGRIAPLLELGAGFHPELTGRENVFLNGTLLGYSQVQMEGLFAEIVEFAELEDFIDAPLRTYSTGMTVRLGFAVATATRPDILIVDEVLSVGDSQFQAKCVERISQFRQQGTTILLVTHDSKLVSRMCDRALWLDHGIVRALGAAEEVIESYERFQNPFTKQLIEQAPPPLLQATGQASELEAQVLAKSWFYPYVLPSGTAVECQLTEEYQSIHTDRLQMVFSTLDTFAKDTWPTLSALDLGCNQGYFAAHLAARGCRSVVGLDARSQNIEDAELIRQVYHLDNLRFGVADITTYEPESAECYDVVLLLSVLFWLENPLLALRQARKLTRGVLVVETPVAPEVGGQIDWGTYRNQKQLLGSFALLDVSQEVPSPYGGLTDLALCPGRETLLRLLHYVGFCKVEVIAPPPGSYEQLASGKRLMVAAYV
jgi:ABC-2 type transport system ATP-binding protein